MAELGLSLSAPTAVNIGGWAAVLTLLGLLVRQWVPLRRIRVSADERLIETLGARVEKLERRIEAKDAQHEAEMSIMRHRANNSDQCIDALLLLLEQSPDKAKEAVAMIKEMRGRQRATEAAEKAAYHAANIARAGRDEP